MASMTETAFLRAAIIANGGSCDDLPDNLESTLYKRLIEVCANGGGGGGGGLPTGGEPYKQLVTDGEGQTVWEDRLAYEDPNALMEILPETSMLYDDGQFVHRTPLGADLTVGKTYQVTYNGVSYSSTAADASIMVPGAVVLGNMMLMDGPDTGEPFAMIVVSDALFAVSECSILGYVFDGAASVTLSIAKTGGSVTINPQYLPNYLYGIQQSEIAEVLSRQSIGASMSKSITVPFTNPLVVGREYIVIISGEIFKCTAKLSDDGSEIYLGSYKGETDDPYTVRYLNPQKAAITGLYGFIYNGLDVDTNIAVFGPGEAVRKVPEKFLPDATSVVLTSPNGTKYKLTVADDGTVSATAV